MDDEDAPSKTRFRLSDSHNNVYEQNVPYVKLFNSIDVIVQYDLVGIVMVWGR